MISTLLLQVQAQKVKCMSDTDGLNVYDNVDL